MARFVAPGVAHHITQRGTARQVVFRTRSDRRVYLEMLRAQARHEGLRILAYCLMSNHVHLMAVPRDEASLAVVLRRVHGRYAQYFNARHGRSGHLWQNRFYSCPLGPSHLWVARDYVETNPVRAGLAETAESYEWSSAAGRAVGQDRWRLLDPAEEMVGRNPNRPDAETQERLWHALRRATFAGQPLGDVAFESEMKQLRRERAEISARLRELATSTGG
jgi:putative transposase